MNFVHVPDNDASGETAGRMTRFSKTIIPISDGRDRAGDSVDCVGCGCAALSKYSGIVAGCDAR